MSHNILLFTIGIIAIIIFPRSYSFTIPSSGRWLSSFEGSMINSRINSDRIVSLEYQNSEKAEQSNVKPDMKTQRYVHPQVLKMFRRAQFLIKKGDNVVAKKLLKRCLELNPYDAHSWLALARLESKTGHLEDARSLFSKGNDTCPNNIHILHAWGHFEQKHNNIIVARDCWSQAVKLDPLNAYVCHALSSLEKRLRNFDRAKQVLLDVTKKRPTAAICVSLADLERQLGNPEKSREVLLDGLRRCTKEKSMILLSLAWLEEDAFENNEEANSLIDEAMKIDGGNIKVHIAKANFELRQGLLVQARKTLRNATSLHSEDGQHYLMWSTLELESGNSGEARAILKDGARLYPGDHFLLQRWGTLEAKLGNYTKARELFERSILVQPHAPTFVAWAIMEENVGMKTLDRSIQYSRGGRVKPNGAAGEIFHNFASTDIEHNSIDESLLSLFPDVPSMVPSSSDSAVVVAEAPVNTSAAALAYAEKKFEESRQLFELGMEADPQHGPVYHAFGNAELRRGNISKAREIFSLGIDRNCSDITALYHALGLLEVKVHNRDVAGAIFRKGIELGMSGSREVDPGLGFLLHSLGMLELDSRRLVEAKKVFETGVGLFPNHSQMLLGLALASMRLGQHNDARRFFRESIDADNDHLHAWQCWAIAEKQLGNIELARVLFRQGLQHGPMHGALWQGYAVMEMQQGNVEIARSLFSQAVQRAPTHAQSYQAWACLEARAHNLERAKELAWEGIRRSPTHAALWTVAGLVEDRLGHSEKAVRIFHKGIQRFPTHGALYKVLGELEARRGNYNDARDVFARGLRKDPYYAPVYHAAALLEAKLGNLERLMELHTKAKEYFRTDMDRVLSRKSAVGSDSYMLRYSEDLVGVEDGNRQIDNFDRQNSMLQPGGPPWEKDNENEDVIEKIRQLVLVTQETVQDGENLLAGEYENDMSSMIADLEHQ